MTIFPLFSPNGHSWSHLIFADRNDSRTGGRLICLELNGDVKTTEVIKSLNECLLYLCPWLWVSGHFNKEAEQQSMGSHDFTGRCQGPERKLKLRSGGGYLHVTLGKLLLCPHESLECMKITGKYTGIIFIKINHSSIW